ncbi:site-specific DNA-methyltransferase [Rhodoblastus sphagnicola]|uniref:site-specific DNA-methyltransferase (adenine-specific) n=1 Tax=Rhodoblastus sphagnicola TaxID=333368 RepID=A0A2S6N231_9HYPH|nr:site-specific DNA-methyltransferase [Rhodoblastus sphagnicola]MBB4199722.1 adenine-specific DNA-methyltransferase [Rhodoblastus sphagnicola]PPQ28662.1 site-specific DNA-methyltransferase [Rhodoblastus sphagnicola]
MARGPQNSNGGKKVATLTHDGAARKNIPTAELQSFAERIEEQHPVEPVTFARANPLAEGETRERDEDCDPQIIWRGARIRLSKEQIRALSEKGEVEIGDAQLVWRGKDRQDWSDLVVHAPPLYIQEKVHPKAIIDDLMRRTKEAAQDDAPDLFSDFNGVDPNARTDFYQHDQHWSNRMILGDSLQVMASLAEREGLRGKVQCIYFDPPYGIKFNSNWQVSTQNPKVADGKQTDISREPEQVKAFRDTWKDGVHSYLTYLRDRLTVAREMLTIDGSVFVQIGDENVHRVRALMDEVFGPDNCISEIVFQKTGGQPSLYLSSVQDYVLWYAKDRNATKFRRIHLKKEVGVGHGSGARYDQVDDEGKAFQLTSLTSNRPPGSFPIDFEGRTFNPSGGYWKTGQSGFQKLIRANRIRPAGRTLRYVRYLEDFAAYPITNVWTDTAGSAGKIYVVQTSTAIAERCILMATDPGDLVLDPTCGSGTTAYVAEQWGRRWITIDTSRVALALARTRLMSARYSYYYLADSVEGRRKEQDISGKIRIDTTIRGDIRHGFVYERVPHITLKGIANNSAIDDIWEKWQAKLEPARTIMNSLLGQTWQEWEIPREAAKDWSEKAKEAHEAWWTARIARQKEIDDSIAKAADVELLYDRPYEDKGRVRVAGPFTVESLSPHRVVPADEEFLGATDGADEAARRRRQEAAPQTDFSTMVLEHLRTAGVHQSEKRDTIHFNVLQGWPGEYIGAEGRFMEGEMERRAAIFIGPEFGTTTRSDLVAAAREATDARFDVLIACAFNFDAHAADLSKLGPLPILKAKMNPDLHMSDDLKNTGKGNLFVVFGEPDIDIEQTGDGQIFVRVNGVDVFDPNTGEIRSADTKGIAAWFIDTEYNEESFFVRHAYFLGANDPYKSLKTALQAEIDRDAWETLYRAESRPFAKPKTGKIAVKVINHFGDEVMKVYRV